MEEEIIEEQKELECPTPYSVRTYLLALPMKRKQAWPYVPPDPYKYCSTMNPAAFSGPIIDNWRINQIAIPYRGTPKWTPPPPGLTLSGVSPATLKGGGTDRSDHLSRPFIHVLQQTLLRYKGNGEKFVKTVNKYIENSWESIYYYYRRMFELKRKKDSKYLPQKAKPSLTPAQKAEREKATKECLARISKPKPVHRPPPLGKKAIANLVKIAAHMFEMSQPRIRIKKYLRPSIDPEYKDPLRVTDGAKKYMITPRVTELAACPPHRLKKEPIIIPGQVKKAALKGPVSAHVGELAVPKRTAAQKDSELKENPFGISPTALKYKPTPRILELAKPKEL